MLTYELYTLAARRSEFRSITEEWMRASRTALEQHFPPEVARMLDAYIEGAAPHIALDRNPPPATLTAQTLTTLAHLPAVR